jgi:hypothetical protein
VPKHQPEEVDAYAVRLALTYPNWVNRRVERFEFVDARTVRRQMSVDFVLPPSDELEPDKPVLVPVMMLRRNVLRRLDVTDGGGRSLNVVESDQGREVAIRGLTAFLTPPAAIEGTEVLADALRVLLDIKSAKGGDDDGLAKLAQRSDEKIEAALEGSNSVQAATVKALIGELGEGVMLLVSVPYRPRVPMLVKVGYDAKLETSLLQSARGLPRIERANFLITRLFSSVGLMGRHEFFTKLPVRLGKSHHIEVAPPPGTYAEEANLVVEEASVERDFDHSRPHLQVRGGSTGTDRGERGSLAVILHARREVSVFPLFFSAAVIAGMLAFVSTQAEHDRVDGITLGAILLAPVALAAYYARSDENEYLTVALRGLRRIATLAILAGVVVIALLALGWIEPHTVGREHPESDGTALAVTRWAWRVAMVCAVALGLALFAPILDEWARDRWVRRRSKSRDGDTRFRLRDMAQLLAPPCFLIVIGVAIVAALLLLHPG